MNNAQIWLNNNIPVNQRANITQLSICSSDCQNDLIYQLTMNGVPENNRYYLDIPLTGELDLSSLVNLKQLDIHGQEIIRLILSGCSNLIDIAVDDNELKIIDFPTDGQQLNAIRLTNNNISPRDLSCFANFRNLRFLYLGTDQAGLRQGKCNRWNGSLIHLLGLNRLLELDINATDVDSGLEYLPTEKLSWFTFGNQGRTEARVNNLQNTLDVGEEVASFFETNNTSCLKMAYIRVWQQEYWQQLQDQIQVNIQRSN